MKIVEIAGHDGDQFFAGPSVDAAWDDAREELSRKTIAYMKPSDFISVAEPGYDPEKMARVLDYLKRGQPFPTLPFIQFDSQPGSKRYGKVLGHEGRHRVRALHLKGVQQMPVILWSTSTRWGDDRERGEGPRNYPLPPQLLPQTTGTPIPMPISATFPQLPQQVSPTQKIGEAIAPPTLYHGTSLDALLQMTQMNEILPSNVDAGPPGVSLTRDPRIAQEKAQLRGVNKHGGVILQFDRNLLRRQFGRRLQPLDVLNIRGSQAPHNPFAGVSEAEERLSGNLPEPLRYITGIRFLDPAVYQRLRAESHPDPVFDRLDQLINP